MAGRVPNPFPKRAAWQKLLDLDQTERKSKEGVTLRLSRFSPFGLDPDNALGGAKFLIDQLRYCGLIQGDRVEEITIEFRQIKTQHKAESGTLVEIFDTACSERA